MRLARASGALALRRDVFGDVPGAGRWACLLLADGNIGISGDPVALLTRARQLVAPTGTVVVETDPPGCRTRRENVRLRTGDAAGPWFPWAWIGVSELAALGSAAGLVVTQSWTASDRWFAALTPARGGAT